MAIIKNFYAWLFCAFAALGACLYGYDGVYFTGVSAMDASSSTSARGIINIGELVGSLTAAPLNDLAGRKGVFFIASIMVVVGVVLQLATDHKHSMIIAGRILLGYGVGNFSATSPLYIGEIAPTRIRGPLLMCWQLVLSISQIIAAAINRGTQGIGSTVAYRVPMGVQLVFPLLVLAFLWWVPESPRWLLRKNKVDAARKSLQSVNRDDKSYIADDDLAILQRDIDNEKQLAEVSSWLDLILDPIERRKTIYSAGALVAQQVNGIQWFYYFGTVFSKAIGLSDPFLMTLIVFIIQVVVVLCAVFCANKLPRRPLLLITTGIMGVSIFVVGCLGIPGGEVSHTFGKVIISFVIIEITAFNFAWGPLGWTIASEMAVGRNRNKIYAVAVACFWITVWAIVFTLPYLYYSANLGPKTGFVYTGLCVITFVYVYFCVGEVTGRSMEEINWFFINGIPARKWRDQPFPVVGETPSEKSLEVNQKNGVNIRVEGP
ncbi:putative sugar transporter protein [Aspergillus bombycis]|uniref:Putative sugar transporter protein n=1 Tax=Aspergillus bombycis TaxID=109264 RepID=A0A1F7ZXP8_9EURO|nr:putative sugar transporter protein [Aspergillus bombycis]OGM44197.1 putative sugar transporter protein [Aspergillus bombycis]